MLQKKNIESLQAMRAIAALLVVLFHFTSFVQEKYGLIVFNNAFQKGDSGVDIFFVISGFIIYYSVKQKQRYSVKEFIFHRIVRIYPIYWIVTFFLLFAQAANLSSNVHREGLDAVSVFTSLLLLPSNPYVLNLAWTLTIEVLFYLFFAATFFFSEKIYFTFMIIWASLCLLSDFFIPTDFPYWISRFVLFDGNIEFLFGSVIAYLFIKGITPYGFVALIMGSTWFLLSMTGTSIIQTLELGRSFNFGIPATLIIYGLVSSNFKIPKWLVKLGDSSYLLYLIHPTILSIGVKIVSMALGIKLINEPAIALLIISMPIIVAEIGYRVVEKPLLKSLRDRLQISLTRKSTLSS